MFQAIAFAIYRRKRIKLAVPAYIGLSAAGDKSKVKRCAASCMQPQIGRFNA